MDHISKIRIEGMRAISNVEIPLKGLKVLIGDNGTGKSTILEAFELLKKASKPGIFIQDSVNSYHGGLSSLLRQGAKFLRLTIDIESESKANPNIQYLFALGHEGTSSVVIEERLYVWANPTAAGPLHAIDRAKGECFVFDSKEGRPQSLNIPPQVLALSAFGFLAQPAIKRVIDVLERIDVYIPFDVQPGWVHMEQGASAHLRAPAAIDRVETLERMGLNLANCFHMLRTERSSEWSRIIELATLGLGEDLRDISTPAAGKGTIELQVVFGRLTKPVPASALSDGQLSYLAFLAISELGRQRRLVAFDEPESHLNPQLMVRVVWLLEELAKECPVLISTHSDRLLDALSNPGDSILLCELDNKHAMHILRPNKKRLVEWLVDYRGLGHLRSEGYEAQIFDSGEKAGH